MQNTTSFRFLPYASTALASLALALSTSTACQSRSDSREVTLDSAVQGERSTVGKQQTAPQETAQPVLPTSEVSAAAEAPLPAADPTAAQPQAASEIARPEQPKPMADVPPRVKRLVLATDVKN